MSLDLYVIPQHQFLWVEMEYGIEQRRLRVHLHLVRFVVKVGRCQFRLLLGFSPQQDQRRGQLLTLYVFQHCKLYVPA